MPRYWVMAPYRADKPELWDRVWKYDLGHSMISIGWRELGDVSSLGEDQLRELIDRTYTHAPPGTKSRYFRMLRDFYHSIKPGDFVIARRGTKKIAAIGTVIRAAYYEHNKNAEALGPDRAYSNHVEVRWADPPREKPFDAPVFSMQTVCEISEEKFRALTQVEPLGGGGPAALEEGVQNQAEFVLEKYLEEFIVANFDAIFKGELVIYSDAQEGVLGQQFHTEVGDIDILAQERKSSAFVVIELKKGRESDKVVGQVLRYMGWVAEKLCQQGQDVKGMIICKEPDARLSYALKMAKNVSVKYYRVDFKLQDHC